MGREVADARYFRRATHVCARGVGVSGCRSSAGCAAALLRLRGDACWSDAAAAVVCSIEWRDAAAAYPARRHESTKAFCDFGTPMRDTTASALRRELVYRHTRMAALVKFCTQWFCQLAMARAAP